MGRGMCVFMSVSVSVSEHDFGKTVDQRLGDKRQKITIDLKKLISCFKQFLINSFQPGTPNQQIFSRSQVRVWTTIILFGQHLA